MAQEKLISLLETLSSRVFGLGTNRDFGVVVFFTTLEVRGLRHSRVYGLLSLRTGLLKFATPGFRRPFYSLTTSYIIHMLPHHRGRESGFTLVEIMIVVAIIALLAAIAVPSALRARKRSQATSTLQTLRVLDAACDQWAIENGKGTGATPTNAALSVYIKKNSKLYNDLQSTTIYDALGNTITAPVVDTPPVVSSATFGSLSDVAPSSFWTPYYSSGS